MRRLLETSDVFIHNIRPDAIDRLGLGYEAVKKVRPDIIYVHCTGFALGGPYAGLQAYDDVIQAASGAVSLLPRVDGNPRPRYVPMLFADKVSGLHAVYATMAALIARSRDGEGQHVEVPMFEVDHQLQHGRASLRRHLRAADRPMGLCTPARSGTAAHEDEGRLHFDRALCGRSLGALLPGRRPSGGASGGALHRQADPAGKNMNQMYEVAETILPEKTTAEWLRILKEAHVPAMRANEIGDVLDDPHLNAGGFFRKREHPTEGGYIEVRQPVRFAGIDYPDARHAPTIGQHTDELNRELGLSD